ncbi:MAG: hypothetical protein GY909_06045 [Oligoflexia bacterium]|nr:hypothetical protein [Oligoflexia bacterium]
MLIRKFFLFLLITVVSSCSLLRDKDSSGGGFLKYKEKYSLTDKSGSFVVEREVGPYSKQKKYVTKYRVLSKQDTSKVLEQSTAISTPGVLGKKFRVLRPFKSQYNVWFEKKKYSNLMWIDLKRKGLMVKMSSPEKQWNGTKFFRFPRGTGLYCYYTQVIECAQFTGFLNKAIKNKGGEMNFHLIWDGYPYIQEQFLNLANNPFENAILKYDGATGDGLKRFSLNVGANVIIYFVNNDLQLSKVFWVSQGLSMVAE